MKQQTNVQKVVTQLFLGVWIMMVLFEMLRYAPSLHFTYNIPLIPSYGITAVGAAVLTGLLNMMPLMLGLGVLLYRNQWKKAEERSVRLQSHLYKSYLVSLIRPLVFQMILFVPAILIAVYIMTGRNISGALVEGIRILVGYLMTFIAGVAVRITIEYVQQWEMKRMSNSQNLNSKVWITVWNSKATYVVYY